MAITFRNYSKTAGITDDYYLVRDFLLKRKYSEYTYARFDWMTTHTYLSKASVGHMGIWECDGQIVAFLGLDGDFGDVFCLTLDGYDYLKEAMMSHALTHLHLNEQFSIVIADEDTHGQRVAASLGMVASTSKESDAIFIVDETPTDYELPEGYELIALKDDCNLFKYGQVLWKGFNHELDGEGLFEMTPSKQVLFEAEMLRPNVNLDLKIAVKAPSGDFVSYCGIWYDPSVDFAVIEPVATVPDFRRMGLGKAVVLEGIRRAGALGAKEVIVGASQQFYYSIGMRPYKTASKWIPAK